MRILFFLDLPTHKNLTIKEMKKKPVVCRFVDFNIKENQQKKKQVNLRKEIYLELNKRVI